MTTARHTMRPSGDTKHFLVKENNCNKGFILGARTDICLSQRGQESLQFLLSSQLRRKGSDVVAVAQ